MMVSIHIETEFEISLTRHHLCAIFKFLFDVIFPKKILYTIKANYIMRIGNFDYNEE